MDRPAAPPIWICASKWTDVPPVLGPSFSCQCICQCVSAAQVAGPAPGPASSFSYYSNFHIHLVRRHPRSIATTRINGAKTDPENSDKFSLPLTCSFFLRPAHKRRPLLVPSFVVLSASRRHTLNQPPSTPRHGQSGGTEARTYFQDLLSSHWRREHDADGVLPFAVDARVQEHHGEPATIHHGAPLRHQHIRVRRDPASDSWLQLTQEVEDGTTSSQVPRTRPTMGVSTGAR